MARNIEILEHGADRLWLLLGRFFSDRAVLKEMRGPIYSGPGMTWFIMTLTGGVAGFCSLRVTPTAYWYDYVTGGVVGFCSLRVTPTAYWYDYDYVVPDARKQGVFTKLAAAREKFMATLPPLPVKTTTLKARWPHYRERGWKIDSERGSWIYGSRKS